MRKDSIKIKNLNDRFRSGDQTVSGIMVVTAGIQAMIDDDSAMGQGLFRTVREYDQFNRENDPHGEHDFGAFTFQGERCFWKIDILDPSLECAPLDATDPQLSKRVLTIMTAREY